MWATTWAFTLFEREAKVSGLQVTSVLAWKIYRVKDQRHDSNKFTPVERELLIFFEIYGQFYGQKLNLV